jgi:hypothetical protein
VTVAVSDQRPVAAGVAADAYRNLRNASGETPGQVRIVSAAQLLREGGRGEVRAADADVARAAPR